MSVRLLAASAVAVLLSVAGILLPGSFGTRAPAGPPAATHVPATGPTADETYLWRPVAIGAGGFITGIAMDPTGQTRVIRTDVHGAYLWNAVAGRWTQLATAATMPQADRVQGGIDEGAYEVAVAPSDPRRIYLAIKGRVYRSDDTGRTWTLRSTRTPFPQPFDANSADRLYGPFLAVSSVDPDLLLLGTVRSGLWRSSDGAATWTHIDGVPTAASGSAGVTVWFGPAAKAGGPLRVFAASAGHGVFVADGTARAFAALVARGAAQPAMVSRAAFAPDGTLFAVDRAAQKAWAFHGGAWTDLTATGALPPRRYIGIAANPHGRQIFLTDEGGQPWCSADGGASWRHLYRREEVSPGDPPYLHLNNQSYFASGQILFDPVVRDRLWVASGVGPYYADVGPDCLRVVWKTMVRGIEEIVANDVVQPPGRAPLFVGWDFGIHRKPDLGVYSTTFGPKERMLISAQQVDWSAADPSSLVTNASDTRTDCCSQDGDSVLAGYSTDGGISWRKFASLPQPPGTRADDPWRMAFGTIAVAADSSDNIVWEPSYNRSPFYTLDRGATWHRVELPGEILPATGSYGSLSGGRKTLAADRVRAGTFYLMHSGPSGDPAAAASPLVGLWRTVDGGRTWQRVFRGEIAPDSGHAAKLRAVPGKAGDLFFTAAVAAGDDVGLRRSRDGGVTWTKVGQVDHVDDIAFGKAAPGAGYPTLFVSGRVAGRYGIWRSTDDALHWSAVGGFPIGRLDRVTVIEADKDVFGRVYLGYQGSGWLYGEPSRCRPRAVRPGDDRECFGL